MSEPATPPYDAEFYDAEFFLDTVCPWCWITSRWVRNVQTERATKVRWRFISLKVLNEGNDSEYARKQRDGHTVAFRILRACHAVRELEGNDALSDLYTAIGTELHVHRRFNEALEALPEVLAECLRNAGLDPAYARYVDDESRDEALRAETAEALTRTGPDVGTPIITFAPGSDEERSFFGPVLPRAPKGDEAVQLWDAVRTIARSNVAEVKRTLRGELVFS